MAIAMPNAATGVNPKFSYLKTTLAVCGQFAFAPLSRPTKAIVVAIGKLRTSHIDASTSGLTCRTFICCYRRHNVSVPTITVSVSLTIPLTQKLNDSSATVINNLLKTGTLTGGPLSRTTITAVTVTVRNRPSGIIPTLMKNYRLTIANRGNRAALYPIP